MGMHVGPAIDGQPPGSQLIRKMKGAMDLRRVAALRLVVPSPPKPRRLEFGDLAIIHGSLEGAAAYRRIVDGYGQYSRQTWPDKPTSLADLRARWTREVAQVRQWTAELPMYDRFGGIPTSPRLRATGFFRAEQVNGRWWLVTPDGNRFFSIGVDAIRARAGATYVERREFMFKELPGPDDPLRNHFGQGDSRVTRSESGFQESERGGFDLLLAAFGLCDRGGLQILRFAQDDR